MQLKSKYLVITSDYLVPLGITVGVLLLIWLTLFSSSFAIKKVICEADHEPCANSALEKEIEKIIGQNTLRFRENELRAKLLSGEFTVREVEITRTLPGTVKVSVYSVLPVVALLQVGDPRYVTLDKDYRVIKLTSTNPNVPVVSVSSLPPIQLGKKLEGEFLPLLSLVLELVRAFPAYQSIEYPAPNMVKLALPEITAVFSTGVETDKQIRLLQAVLSDSTILSGKQIVDVRFTQPVLK